MARPLVWLKPGVLTGASCPAMVLNEPWENKVFFAAAETARKLDEGLDKIQERKAVYLRSH